MIVAVDDTITAKPEFFPMLTKAVMREKGKVLIVSSRTKDDEQVIALFQKYAPEILVLRVMK